MRADLSKHYVRCFETPAGRVVLEHLREITIERFFGANATEGELRTLEGSRSLVHQIEMLIQRGK
jgi:hypothetical protein